MKGMPCVTGFGRGRRLAVRKEALALVLKASFRLKNSREASIDHAASEPLPQTRWVLCGDIPLKRQAFNVPCHDIAGHRMQFSWLVRQFLEVTKQLLKIYLSNVQQTKGGDPVSLSHAVSPLKISPAAGMRF